MSLPALQGTGVHLLPVTLAVARAAVLSGEGSQLESALGELGVRPGAGWPHADTADALRPLAEHGAEGDDGGWLIVVDGQVIGDCGWRGGPDPDGDAELGYGLSDRYRGQGLGTRAVAVMADWCAGQPGVARLTAEVLPGNLASRRLLERLGFREEGITAGYVRYVKERLGYP